ncbi:filamentation protein [Aspergillus steynii IBT 23096]|uniref:Filamentation protein n=1 Tax=Aspergillus steynii IBT 23096 TaxID=1392250 RepID=A0A2I2FRA4_9EURO|nr:filamentation protein [Aspergillus steynii IBT 23096]PLB43165.1 filamentation protein [Aspergillus steynii IBT 23096]
MAGRESDKGYRYVAALDTARCQNRWDELPELIRKVTKHAPQKSCLLEVASAEYQIAAESQKGPPTARPSSSSSLPELIPSLLSTVERGSESKEDTFQAQVCLGWVHWTLNEPGLAVARLPRDFGETIDDLTTGEHISPWTEVCIVKSCYLKGASQHMISSATEAIDTFNSLVPWLTNHGEASSNNPQFLHWSEKLLGEGAFLASQEALKQVPVLDGESAKTAFKLCRLWSSHPLVKQGVSSPVQHFDGDRESISKSAIWKSYYDLLSAVLVHELEYYPPANGPDRPQLSSEIRRVESLCETNLLREVKFPTAESKNVQVEDWVEQVIQNWEILCGSGWTDDDLGEGGQNAVGRNVLDILYRAATKTYHSHLILRRLFHVHSALADFDLALKALDSYIEIVTNAKERAEKAAQYGDLENDGTLLRTVSEGITMLCCFGSAKEAEKAKALTSLLVKFVEKHVQEDLDDEEGRLIIVPESNSTKYQAVSPCDVATAYRGIGIGLANWANWTPINEDRNDIRAEAIDYLEKSIAPELEDETNFSSLYALALLLAEDRDLDGAIEYVKTALTSNTHPGANQGNFARERDLVPLWHLLALLLSAKHDFDIAERSCEAAFEQFPSAVTSLAHSDRRPQKQHSNLRERPGSPGLDHALIDQLQGREKERIVETRMSQLAFIELLEGPEAAVNHSDQLLGLFATLFGNLNLEADEKKTASVDHLTPPKSSAGTVKSLRGSIFGRNRGSRVGTEHASDNHSSSVNTSVAHNESSINMDGAPSIHVTDEDRQMAQEAPQPVARSDSKKLRKRSSTLRKSEVLAGQQAGQVNGDMNAPEIASVPGTQQPSDDGGLSQDMVGLAVSSADKEQSVQNSKHPLRPAAHNIDHKKYPPPIGHSQQPPEQDVRLPTLYGFDSPTRAITKFPIAQAQKHALCILVKTWLLIAGLYRRASLFDDAREACDEAAKQVTRFEALSAVQESSARSFTERAWGSPKSSEELWADLLAEQALLCKAQSRPHDAMDLLETALLRNPDHPKATITLANFLLDIWDQKLPLEPPETELQPDLSTPSLNSARKQIPDPKEQTTSSPTTDAGDSKEDELPSAIQDEEPRLLNRIAARDRAYGLLSVLTKQGSSWDNTEAWYALSKAFEAQGHIEKLKEVLWWCIELEDRRPIRHWSNIGSGVYVL